MRYWLFYLLLFFNSVQGLQGQSGTAAATGVGDTMHTAAVHVLERSKFNQGNLSSPVQCFQGKLPGLAAARPGSNPNQPFVLRMRGLSSFQSQAEPLIVLDGMPIRDLSWIDPYDLQSATLWKDGMAAVRYGMQAGPGVLQIQTPPAQVSRWSVQYHSQAAFEWAAKRYAVLDASEFQQYGGKDLSPVTNTNTDWQDLVLQRAVSQTHRIAFSAPLHGAGSALEAALSYRNLEGVLRESGQQQYNGSLRFRQEFQNRKIRLSGALRAARRAADLSFPEAFRYALTFNPTAPVRNDDLQNAPFGGYVTEQLFDYFNPVAIIEQNANRNQLQAWIGTARAEFDLFSGLTGHLQIGREQQALKTAAFYSPQSYFRGFQTQGAAAAGLQELQNHFLDAGSRYVFPPGRLGSLELSAGYTWQRYDYEATRGSAGQTAGLSKNSDLQVLYQFATQTGSAYSKGRNTLAAAYGQARWNFREFLFLELGVRREGSSRLGKNNRWHNFSSAGIAADFSKIFSWRRIDQFQLRGSYGVTGQQPAYDGLSQGVFTPSGSFFYYNGVFEPGFFPAYNNNYALGPEKTGTLNLGLEFSAGNQRLKGSFDYFQRKSADLILRASVPAPPNISNYTYLHLGRLTSRGWDAGLSWQDILTNSRLTWSAELALGSWRTTVEKHLDETAAIFGWVGAPGNGNVGYGLLFPGMPYGQFWGPVRAGLDANGAVQYKDINRDGVVEPWNAQTDMTAIGNATPALMLGLNQSFEWRRWDFNLFLRGIFGHELAHENRIFYENIDPSFTPFNKVKTDYFNPNIKSANRLDDTHIEKAGFLRLDNLTLGYRLPLRESGRVEKLRLYLGGQNLFTLTGYTGLDPELRLQDNGPTDNGGTGYAAPDYLLPGVDRRGAYIPVKTIFLGVQLQL